MPPRHATQCYRTIQSQTSSQLEAYWITDNVLCQAFDRYCYVSRVSRRFGSAVPGPLENRRRLGKRRMTELTSMQANSTLPPWALPNAVDLSRWRWEPPSTPSFRLQTSGDGAVEMPVSQPPIPQWLVDWTQDAQDKIQDGEDRAEIYNKQFGAARHLVKLFEDLAEKQDSNAKQFTSTYRGICNRIEQQLSLGLLNPEELDGCFSVALPAWNERFGSEKSSLVARILFIPVMRGIKSCRVLGSDTLELSFWSTVLQWMTKLPVTKDLLRVLTVFAENVPERFNHSQPELTLALLDKIFLSWTQPEHWRLRRDFSPAMDQAGESSKRASDVLTTIKPLCDAGDLSTAKLRLIEARRQVDDFHSLLIRAADLFHPAIWHGNLIVHALKRMTADPNTNLLHTATELVVNNSSYADELQQRVVRDRWLSIVAQVPMVSQETLLEMALTLYGPGLGNFPLSGSQICYLLLLHHVEQGHIARDKQSRDYIDRISRQLDSTSIALVIQSVYHMASPQGFTTYLESLWTFLTAFGREDELVSSLETRCTPDEFPPALLRTVACTSNDHHVVLAIHSICSSQSCKLGTPRFWDKFVERMAADPTVDPSHFLHILNTEWYLAMKQPTGTVRESGAGAERQLSGRAYWKEGQFVHTRLTQQTVNLVEMMAIRLAQTPHLRSGLAFRWVARCVRYLGQNNRKLSVGFLKTLGSVVTQDLVEGQPGRTARLRWYLGLLEKHLGDRPALATAIQLRRWRDECCRLLAKEQRTTTYRPSI